MSNKHPDAWFTLVLRTMSIPDLLLAIRDETDADKLRWLRAELVKRTAPTTK